MPEETQVAPVEEQTQAGTSAETQKPDTATQEQTIPLSRFNEVNNELKALKADAAKRAKEQETENEKKLAEQAQWQKLYEDTKGKVADLTPKAELADKLSALVLEQYTAEIKEWPEQVRNMAPPDEADVLTKLDWMHKAKPLATELMGSKQVPVGTTPRPRPSGPVGSNAQEQAARKEHGHWTRNQF